MRKLLLKQATNYLKSLGFWQRLQIVLMALPIYLFLSFKIGEGFTLLQQGPWPLSLGMILSFLVLNLISSYLNLRYGLPRQKSLMTFQTLPLDTNQLSTVIGLYFLKVQLPLFIIQFILVSGVIFFAPLAGCVLLVVSFFSGYLVFKLQLGFFFHSEQEIHLEQICPPYVAQFKRKKTASKEPQKAIGLFPKELLQLWRNPRYRRLKIFSFIFYLAGLILLYQIPDIASDMWMMLFSTIVFWTHYNVHFISKYVSAEPDWYFRSLPIKFYRAWFSRFFAELLYVLIFLIAQWLFLALVGIEPAVQVQWIGALLLFAVIILIVVLNFQILFYDNPRLAGYAYHFTIIFILVSSFNYRLVGPLSSLFLLAYFSYKTRQFYRS